MYNKQKELPSVLIKLFFPRFPVKGVALVALKSSSSCENLKKINTFPILTSVGVYIQIPSNINALPNHKQIFHFFPWIYQGSVYPVRQKPQ